MVESNKPLQASAYDSLPQADNLMLCYFFQDSNTQMQDFQMFYDDDGTEVLLFDQTGVDYGQGFFTIPINPPVTTSAIIIRRDGTLTLCEVEIFGGKITFYYFL